MRRFKTKPMEIEAMPWIGETTGMLEQYLGQNWGRADAKGVAWNHTDKDQVVIYNSLEKAWIPCPVGHWIIRGMRGEFYPCDPHVFHAKYEEILS